MHALNVAILHDKIEPEACKVTCMFLSVCARHLRAGYALRMACDLPPVSGRTSAESCLCLCLQLLRKKEKVLLVMKKVPGSHSWDSIHKTWGLNEDRDAIVPNGGLPRTITK